MNEYSEVIAYGTIGAAVGLAGGIAIKKVIPEVPKTDEARHAAYVFSRIGVNALAFYYLSSKANVFGVSDPYMNGIILWQAMMVTQPDLFPQAAAIVRAQIGKAGF